MGEDKYSNDKNDHCVVENSSRTFNHKSLCSIFKQRLANKGVLEIKLSIINPLHIRGSPCDLRSVDHGNKHNNDKEKGTKKTGLQSNAILTVCIWKNNIIRECRPSQQCVGTTTVFLEVLPTETSTNIYTGLSAKISTDI